MSKTKQWKPGETVPQSASYTAYDSEVFKPHNKPKKRVCVFCDDKNLKFIDYKDVNRLRKFVTEKGKILPSRQTGTCARHQRELTVAIKRARNMALLPFSGD